MQQPQIQLTLDISIPKRAYIIGHCSLTCLAFKPRDQRLLAIDEAQALSSTARDSGEDCGFDGSISRYHRWALIPGMCKALSVVREMSLEVCVEVGGYIV